MKWLKWSVLFLSVFLITTCGSDDTLDQNNPGNPPTENDLDADGISNSDDQCPDTPSDEQADEYGCAPSQKDSDGDGVNDALDICPDTPANTEVNEEGCSAAQSDTSAPEVTNIEITEVGPESFKVTWDLNEASKGYIRYGTSSGNYQDSTTVNNDYLITHMQIVGGENSTPLTPDTSYFWQIYTEDENGNSGYWEERSTKTGEVEEARTYIPDDAFEQFLIDQGYDDTADDYVLTENIQGLEILEIGTLYEERTEYPIEDWTGIQDFTNLKELSILHQNISTLEKLETAPNLRALDLWANDGVSLIVKNFPQLEEFGYGSFADYTRQANGLEIINNPKLKEINISHVSIHDGNTTGNIKIENNPELQKITGVGTFSNIFEVNNNPSLTSLILGDYEEFSSTNLLTINNNIDLEELSMVNFETRDNTGISNCPNIKILRATGTSSQSAYYKMDLSLLTALEELYLEGITWLEITENVNLKTLEIGELSGNNISSLDVSNNNLLSNLKINGHELNCIRVNQSQLDNIPETWEVNPQVSFSLDCN